MNIPLVDLKTQYKYLKKKINKSFNKTCQLSAFIKGPILEEFERDFANFIGTKFCAGVASGTDALYIGLTALGIGKDDEVILPVNTFISTAYSIIYTGAKPVFIDIDPLTQNINVEEIEKRINKRTRAIIPVHLYGQPAEMNKIMQLAKKYNFSILEDCAQAHGATYHKKNVGTFGEIGAFSFYPGKNLGAYGDGGAITTNSSKLIKLIKEIREYGSAKKYYYRRIGINSRLDTLQAAILQIKLKSLDKWNKKRQKAASYYNKIIKGRLPFIKTPVINKHLTSVFHLYVIQAPKRDKLIKYLASKGIECGIHYPVPLHLQKSLNYLGYRKGDFPIAEKLSKEILSLPIYPELTFKQQDFIIGSIKKFFTK